MSQNLKKTVLWARFGAGVAGLRSRASTSSRSILLTSYSVLISSFLLANAAFSLAFLQNEDPQWYSQSFYLVLDKTQILSILTAYLATLYSSHRYGGSVVRVERALEEEEKAAFTLGVGVPKYPKSFLILALRVLPVVFGFTLDASLYTFLVSRYAAAYLIFTYGSLVSIYAAQVRLCTLIGVHSALYASLVARVASVDHFFQLESLARLHSRLRASVALLNSVYSAHLLFSITSCFIATIGNMFVWSEVAFAEEIEAGYLTVSSFLIILRIYEACWIVEPCVALANKAKEFNQVLYDKVMEDMTEGYFSNEKLRLHLGLNKEVAISVCGFFDLDRPLLHSMLGGVTTLLVILVQFDMTGLKTCNNTSESSDTNA